MAFGDKKYKNGSSLHSRQRSRACWISVSSMFSTVSGIRARSVISGNQLSLFVLPYQFFIVVARHIPEQFLAVANSQSYEQCGANGNWPDSRLREYIYRFKVLVRVMGYPIDHELLYISYSNCFLESVTNCSITKSIRLSDPLTRRCARNS